MKQYRLPYMKIYLVFTKIKGYFFNKVKYIKYSYILLLFDVKIVIYV